MIFGNNTNTEKFVRRAAETVIPTRHGGEFKIIAYENDLDNLFYTDHVDEAFAHITSSLEKSKDC